MVVMRNRVILGGTMKFDKFSLFVIFALILASCKPELTKQSYLDQYNQFISEVNEKRNNPNFNWNKYDSQFERLSQTLYERFENELALSEKVTCRRNELSYLVMRSQNEMSVLKGVFIDELKKSQEQLENYIENNMHDDLNFLLQEVSNIKALTFRVLNQVLKTVDTDGFSTSP